MSVCKLKMSSSSGREHRHVILYSPIPKQCEKECQLYALVHTIRKGDCDMASRHGRASKQRGIFVLSDELFSLDAERLRVPV